MHLKAVRIKNFRRLKDVTIDLEKDTSIFVGANNSGKTSASHLLNFLLGEVKHRFSIHDFSSKCWKDINTFGNEGLKNVDKTVSIPKITCDLWFKIEEKELYRVVEILPQLDWQDVPVGIRIEFAPKSTDDLIKNFSAAVKKSEPAKSKEYQPWPTNLTDYLEKRLNVEYELSYYVLNYSEFDEHFKEKENASPRLIPKAQDNNGAKVLSSLVRFDFLSAQRHLSDDVASRSENLSKRLNRFYQRNLQKREDDLDAMKALANSEAELSLHLSKVFQPILKKLNDLGYPGFADPQLVIKAAISDEQVVSQNAKLHYSIEEEEQDNIDLPDKYNGLGFKNLIYMVVELLDFHAKWLSEDEETRAPLHLIVIEEPEVHLHTQLQQVFIGKVLDLLKLDDSLKESYRSQLIVTTHSPHIIYESGFRPIRYFRRKSGKDHGQTSDILNLSTFYNSETADRDFLERYMKITHCDLFFADAAILVEGNVERLLLPMMIQQCAPKLKSCYLSILEVGGAFAFRFKKLIEFLGIKTLIITDLDSVHPPAAVAVDEETEENEGVARGTCMVHEANAVTSNQTLIQWLPRLNRISDLISATEESKIQKESGSPLVRVAYQAQREIIWGGNSKFTLGRTLEEDFALENLTWTQHQERKKLGLCIKNSDTLPLDEICAKLFKKVTSSSFRKTDFALGLMTEDPSQWIVPKYIRESLCWLEKHALPSDNATKPGDTPLRDAAVNP